MIFYAANPPLCIVVGARTPVSKIAPLALRHFSDVYRGLAEVHRNALVTLTFRVTSALAQLCMVPLCAGRFVPLYGVCWRVPRRGLNNAATNS